MNRITATLVGFAASMIATAAMAAPIASGQISFGGYARSNTGSMGTATGIAFADAAGGAVAGTSGVLSSFGAGSGTFAALGACSSTTIGCGSIQDIANFVTEANATPYLVFDTGGPAVRFDLTAISGVTRNTSAGQNSLTVTAFGIIEFEGFANTLGRFILTSEGNGIDPFSATLLAAGPAPAPNGVPEPDTIALLGLGLLAVGAAKRRVTRA